LISTISSFAYLRHYFVLLHKKASRAINKKNPVWLSCVKLLAEFRPNFTGVISTIPSFGRLMFLWYKNSFSFVWISSSESYNLIFCRNAVQYICIENTFKSHCVNLQCIELRFYVCSITVLNFQKTYKNHALRYSIDLASEVTWLLLT
jgi:hypothetical protein